MNKQSVFSSHDECGKSSTRDLEELLSGVADRTDLEWLFQREVPLADILRLIGRGERSSRVVALLASHDTAMNLYRLKLP